MDSTNLTDIIIKTINTIFQNLFSSIDNSLYSLLDDLVFINIDILDSSFLEKILGNTYSSGLILIANALLIGFFLYYTIKLLYSYYLGVQVESPYQVIFKAIIFGICMNFSYFICFKLLEINSLISSSIQEIGENIFNSNISFSQLINNINSIVSIDSSTFNIFSFDGLLKSFISISLFNLVFSYSLRYIMVNVFILIMPFAILSLINYSTSWFFKVYLKAFFSLLLLQSLVSLILLIIFSFDFSSQDIFNKLICIGGIYALVRANSYMKELIGGINTDISANFHSLTSFIKK